nr:hypothetical protein [Tanacetum cinerariifolium]
MSRYPCEAFHGHKSENRFRKSVSIHKLPTKSLLDVGSSRISIFTVIHVQVRSNIIKHTSDRWERPITEFVKFIRAHCLNQLKMVFKHLRGCLGQAALTKKGHAKADRGKGIELLFKETQMKKALKKSRRETHKLQASCSNKGADFESEVPDEQTDKPKDTNKGIGEKPGVLNVSKDDSTDSEANSWGDSEEENDDVNDEDENTDDNEKDNSNNDDGGNDDECGNDDSDQTDLDYDENPSFTLKDYKEQEQYEEFVLTPKRNKSDDDDKMYKEEDDDVLTELVSALETKVSQFNQTSQFVEVVSSIPGIVDNYLSSKLKEEVNVAVRRQSNKLKKEAGAKNQEFINQDIFTSYGDVVTLKRGRDEQDKDEDLFIGSDRGTKKESQARILNHQKTQSQRNQSHLALPKAPNLSINLLTASGKSFVELEYHFQECYKAVNDRLDWHNPKRRGYPFDLSKTLSLIEDRGRQVVPAEYFVNNDLGYLKGGS